MSGFQYFVPNHTGAVDVAALGLGYAFDHPGRKHPVQVAGPDGQHGLLLSDPQRVPLGRDGYYPERQRWVQTARGYYVGMEKAEPPTPAELLRGEPIAGRELKLGDERRWLVPLARQWMLGETDNKLCYSIEFDQRIELGKDGAIQEGAVLPRYAELWGLANAWLHAWHYVHDDQPTDEAIEEAALGGAPQKLTLQDGWVLAARVLSANYAVSIAELALLGVLTKRNWQTILNTLVDYDTYQLLRAKKNAQDSAGDSSSNGPADSSPTTDPPAPT